MSTKTLRKRIALVAVSALGFGLMSVAPAKAGAIGATAITLSSTSQSVQAGTAITAIDVTPTVAANLTAAADVVTLTLTLTKPSNSAVTTTDIDGGGASSADIFTDTNKTSVSNRVVGHTNDTAVVTVIGTDSATVTASAASVKVGELALTPDVPGVYTLTVSAGTGGGTATATITVLPSTSTTTSLTALAASSLYKAVNSTTGVINVSRNAGAATTDGQILARVDSVPNSGTHVAIGTILGKTAAKVDGVTAALVSSTTSTSFTFDIAATATATAYGPGTYSFTFFLDANSNGLFDSGEVTTTGSLVIGAAPDSIAVSIDKTVLANEANYNTFVVTATITDAAGIATVPATAVYISETTSAASETGDLNLTNITDATVLTRIGTTNKYTGTFSVDASPATTSPLTYVTVYTDAIAISSSKASTSSLRVATIGDVLETVGSTPITMEDTVGIGEYTAGVRDVIALAYDSTSSAVSVDASITSIKYTFSGKAGEEGKYLKVAVAPQGNTSSTVVSSSYNLVKLDATNTATYTVTATGKAATTTTTADSYRLTLDDANGNNPFFTITYKTAAPAWTLSPSSDIKAKFGDKISVTGTLSDQFGRVLADKAIYVSAAASGRNGGRTNATTDAKGAYTFTWTDASASTTILTDSITFNYDYLATAASTTYSVATSSARKVTYSATGIVVGSVTVTVPTDTNTRPIDFAQTASGDPAAGSVVTHTVTVKTAAGAAVGSGVLVTFTGGADDIFTSGATKVTDSSGQASIDVYRQKTGSSSITATAGGITSAAATSVKWTNDLANNTAASAPYSNTAKRNARYIALSVDSATAISEGTLRFTATVTDRFGNPVTGATVTFSETGAGRFMSGQTLTDAVTNSLGQVSVDLNSNAGETGDVSVSALLTTTGGASQLDDVAGRITVNKSTDGTNTTNTAVNAIAGVTAAVKSATATATITKDTSVSTADALLELAKAQTAAAEATKAAEAARKATEDANAAALLELAKAIGTGKSVEEAADAAAEAIDAANAATDAANLAAEAADAATVAAEEARDAADSATAAVEELATQVATLMAALKAQLTTLANTVAKIAKKVKA